MEAGPNTSIRHLVGKGCHVLPATSDPGGSRAGDRNLRDVLAPERRFDDTRESTAHDTMCAWILGVHRGVIDRLPGCFTVSSRIVINIAIANCSDRSPEIVMVLGIENGDVSVVEANCH